jgi:N-acetyl-anhydromuramyl-L-alanine amidase AmpD
MTVEKPVVDTSLVAKNRSPRTTKIQGVALHDTAGSGKNSDARYLAHPGDGRNVSVDFVVARDGVIFQLNPDLVKQKCFHAGRATAFKGYKNGQCNNALVGIEIIQKADLSLHPLYPQEQVKAVAVLVAWLCEQFKLVPADIVTHRQIITDGSRSDPRHFPFDTTAGEPGFWYHFWEAKGMLDNYLASQVKKVDPPKG